jgi:hypothetical protein
VNLFSLGLASVRSVRGEATLQIFQLSRPEITAEMPELAEAGCDYVY